MRRSGKPWYRARNVALALLAAVALWLGWGVFAAWTATPGAAVDYIQKTSELVASYQPGTEADPNAWEPFMEAVEAHTGIKGVFWAEAGGWDKMPEDWPAEWGWPFDFSSLRDPAAPEVVVASTMRAVEMMREAGVPGLLAEMAARGRSVRPPPRGAESLMGVLLPELGEARQLSRWCAARMRMAAASGDMREVAAAFEQGMALGRVVGSQWTLIDRLVGVTIVNHMLNEVKHELAAGQLDAATCRELIAVIDRQTPLPPLELALEGERLFMLDTIQWTHTDDGRGSGRLIMTKLKTVESLGFDLGGDLISSLPDHPAVNVVGFLFPSKAESTAKVNELMDNCIRLSRLPPTERSQEAFNPALFVQALPRGFRIVRLLAPALGKGMASGDQIEIELSGTRVMLALEMFRAEHGRYPERIEELVPGVLSEVPIDPYSGMPLAFRLLTEDEAQGGWRYTLYSVGADGVDDDGTGDGKDRPGSVHKGTGGSDFIVNTPE